MYGTHARLRSIGDECAWRDPATFHVGGFLDRSLVVQRRLSRHGRHASVLLAAGTAGLARTVRHQLRSRSSGVLGARNLRTPRMLGQPADSLCFNVGLSQERLLFFEWGN